jgi:deoxyribose-phosphate aldolase
LANDSDRYGYASAIFVNDENESGGNISISNGWYYIVGNGFVELPAGTHTIQLMGEIIGGDFGFRATFGTSDYERFQVIVHR